MMTKMMKTAGILCALLLSAAVPRASAQFSIKIKPWFGAGYSRLLTDYEHDFAIADTLDEHYFNRNLTAISKDAFHGQLRLDVLHVYDLSLGYYIWGHQSTFDTYAPDGYYKTGTTYPDKVHYTLQGLCLTWRLPYGGLGTETRMPYLLFGAGKYKGSYRAFLYEEGSAANELDETYVRIHEYDDWGFTVGAGVVLFRYAYLFAGVTELQGDNVKGSRYFDLMLGLTL